MTTSDSRCYWRESTTDLARTLSSDPAAGLSSSEAAARLQKYGPNQLAEKEGERPFRMFLRQFDSFLIWVLIVAALVSGFMKEWVDAAAILAIVVLNAVLGFVQEYRAEKALSALKKMASPFAKVIRSGQLISIPAAELVPGDLIEIEAGDHVPADCRVVSHTSNFSVEEASLTGESSPVSKQSGALDSDDLPLGDRTNMVFMGTSVVSGKGRAMITVTGMQTELGRIAGMLQGIERESTPLQRNLDQFGTLIVKICLVLVALVFWLQWWRGGWRGDQLAETFLTAVSLAVAAIPEGLPAVVTIALALGVQRMVKRNALIRKLSSVETLGCATVICSDKTGTLTKNEMTVQSVYSGQKLFKVTGTGYEPKGEFTRNDKTVKPSDDPDLISTLMCGTLCNGANLITEGGQNKITGDPTEAAILTCAAKAGIWKAEAEKKHVYVDEIPFDSDRKLMTVLRRTDGSKISAFVKGAPDVLLARCTAIEENGRSRPLSAKDKDLILRTNAELADQAMRVLALASRDIAQKPDNITPESIETGLTFLGLVAMIDPPRQEAREAIAKCKTAGIRAVMITGDHKNTAVAVGRELGLFEGNAQALTGSDLDGLSDQDLEARVENTPVYARVSPEHKLRIVRAWRKKHHIVAMTGDGVNDAPAVKEADIGVAMGITGTDVTKEVSDMIVTDDNFASIVSAVEEGRGIYDNIQKVVHYLLSCNAGEILVMLVSSLIGMPAPLVPIQILWVNLVTDGLPALALGMDPVDPAIMKRPPRDTLEPVVNRQRGLVMVLQGVFIAACALGAFLLVHKVEGGSLARARTAAFVVLSCSQLFHAFNCRSTTQSIFKLGVYSNIKLVYAVTLSFLLQFAVVSIPFLQRVFKAESLSTVDWLIVLALSSFPLWAMEVVKALRSGNSHQPSQAL
jgi:Ca2+-transporting ATPase